MNNKDFVPYQEALDLKELGFDEGCLAVHYEHKCYLYSKSRGVKNSNKTTQLWICTAPTYSQAFRWFREKHKLHSCVEFDKLKETDEDLDIELYRYRINEQWQVGKDWSDYRFGFKHICVGNNYKTYEEAELDCLKKLIEIVKNEKNKI